MKYNELVRILKDSGWELYKHGANHDIYRHKDKLRKLVIPRHGHKEVPIGTCKSILKEAIKS